MNRRRTLGAALAIVMAAAALTQPGRAWAGESEWATAGKILTGVVGAAVLGSILQPCERTPAYACHEPVHVVRAVPVEYPCHVARVRRRPRPRRMWVPGHYECTEIRTWQPGTWHTEVTQIRRCGRWVEVRESVLDPGHWVTHQSRVWVEGHYERR